MFKRQFILALVLFLSTTACEYKLTPTPPGEPICPVYDNVMPLSFKDDPRAIDLNTSLNSFFKIEFQEEGAVNNTIGFEKLNKGYRVFGTAANLNSGTEKELFINENSHLFQRLEKIFNSPIDVINYDQNACALTGYWTHYRVWSIESESIVEGSSVFFPKVDSGIFNTLIDDSWSMLFPIEGEYLIQSESCQSDYLSYELENRESPFVFEFSTGNRMTLKHSQTDEILFSKEFIVANSKLYLFDETGTEFLFRMPMMLSRLGGFESLVALNFTSQKIENPCALGEEYNVVFKRK